MNSVMRRFDAKDYSLWWIRFNWNTYVVYFNADGDTHVFEATTGRTATEQTASAIELWLGENA